MKPTPVGTPVKLTTDAGLQNVDVPVGATHVVLFFTTWAGGLGINLDAATAGSFFSSLTRQQTPADSAFNNIGVAWAAVTATGAQTITPAWTNTPGSGPVMVLLFYKDVDSIIDLEAATLAGTVSIDLSAPDTADTLVVAAESQDGSAPDLPGSGWTDITDHAGGGIAMRVRSATTTTNPTTVASVGSSYPAVAGIAIKGTTGGGGDTTAPILSSAAGAATGSTTASGSVSTDEANGTLYRVTTTNASESAATVKAGASQAVSATGVQNMGATGLTPSTTYRHHYLHRDAAGNDSSVVSTSTFTTDAPPDTTAPTLSSPTGTKTGANTATGTVSTNEANGTLSVVVTTSATKPSIAQVRAGQTNTGSAAPWSGNQAVSSTGTKTANATGLTPSTAYYYHFQHRDAAGNDSTVETSASFTTDPPSDVTPPTLSSGVGTVKSNALIEVGATTNEANGTMYAVLTTSATPPSAAQVRAGQNNAGTAAAWAANQAIGSTGAKTFNAAAPAAATGYYPYIVHRDAAGNDSSVLSIGLRTTFRNGATGQYILDHPDSFMAQCVEVGDEDAWFDWELISGPASGAWVEGPYADGTGVFEGPDATSIVIRLRRNDVVVGNFTVYLYDPGHYATPANSVSGSTSTPSNAVQTYRATPAGGQSGATVSSTSAVQVQVAAPANAVSGSTSTPSNATQTYRATPADSVSGATVTSSSVSSETQTATPANSLSGSTCTASEARQTYQATPADGQSGSTVRSTRAFVISREPSSDVAFYPVRNNRTGYPVY